MINKDGNNQGSPEDRGNKQPLAATQPNNGINSKIVRDSMSLNHSGIKNQKAQGLKQASGTNI